MCVLCFSLAWFLSSWALSTAPGGNTDTDTDPLPTHIPASIAIGGQSYSLLMHNLPYIIFYRVCFLAKQQQSAHPATVIVNSCAIGLEKCNYSQIHRQGY